MDISLFKKSTSKIEQIDMQTVHNLWNLLRARYNSIEAGQMLINFVHDKDLEMVIERLLKHFQTQTEQMEKEVEKFKVKGPPRPAIDIKTSTRIDELTDKFIYKRMHADMMSEMFSLSTSVRTTLTNDRLRKLFRKFLLSHLNDFESLYKYGKLKGWEEIPPAYKTTKQVENEPIAVGEAWHIWHNLNDRYLQSELSQLFLVFTHDTSFQAVLTMGITALKKQIKAMEQVALKYEVPMPERPPASSRVSVDPENFEDKFMYQLIYKGIDDSIDMHIRGVIDILRNDNLRKMFLDIYSAELDIQDNYLKLGKMKGWARVPPIYVEPT